MSSLSKPELRIIHHWACSGGTVISKCIASLPNIIFLNEINPNAYLRFKEPNEKEYLPTDLIQQLSFKRNGKNPNLCIAALTGAIQEINKTIKDTDNILILRDHSYIDFFIGPIPRKNSILSETLSAKNALHRLFTVRHPLDSWLSLKEKKWDKHIQINSFDEYCSRINIMINSMKDVPMVYYEDFCLNPLSVIENICEILKLKYSESFLDKFYSVVMSGDSGRKGDVILPRNRRYVSEEFKNYIKNCKKYLNICDTLRYVPDYSAPYPYLLGC